MLNIKRTESNIVQQKPNPYDLNQSSGNLYSSNLSHKSIPQLKISRQDVYREDCSPQDPHNGLENNIHPEQQLNNSKLSKQLWRSKLPIALKQSLRKRAVQSGHFKPKRSTQKVSTLTKSIFAKIGKQQITCGICIGVIKGEDIVKLCQCHHVYCKICIRDYVAYKIKTFEEVLCPEEECNSFMSQKTDFYHNLPEDIKKQYFKVHNFYVTSNDPSLKLCPKQDCEGIIKIIQNKPRTCEKCKRQFCPECSFEKHAGDCEQREIDFFHNNLHYRQCQNCKTIVERTEGCNHMTCRCRYEFCYLCGRKWTGYDHVCNQTIAEIRARNGGMFADGGLCDCCACQDTYGEVCGCMLTIPVRLLLGSLMGVYLTLILATKGVMIAVYLAGSILAGIFGYAPDLLCQAFEQNLCTFILLFVFPMVPLCVGIFRAMRQFFWDMASEEMGDYCYLVQRVCRGLWA